jgi:hypothetical protein
VSAGNYPRIDDSDVLIIRGVSSTDELGLLGLPMAERYQRASRVILIGDNGSAKVVKDCYSGSQDYGLEGILFVDADSRPAKLMQILWSIKIAYEELHPKTSHLAHCHVGMFIFYWVFFADENHPVVVRDLIEQGDLESLEKAAQSYIDSDFGGRASVSGDDDRTSAGSPSLDDAQDP